MVCEIFEKRLILLQINTVLISVEAFLSFRTIKIFFFLENNIY